MDDIVIRAQNLGKLYRITERQPYKTLRDAISNAFSAGLKKFRENSKAKDKSSDYIWALRNISFEVKRGEILGIIGRNGAGKTTLLKILSRITPPTEGYAEVNGRVGSLLEVGTGFHPELTGGENIYLNGVILGMKKAEIQRKFDEIVAFAEVDKFVDTPVKHYSSGMYVRLAFAIAAHLEPEILLVDEVLAVGDAAFQKKCLGKMGDVAKEGRTVLFVSHNMSAVGSICPESILLDEGRFVVKGPSPNVITRYLISIATNLPSSIDTLNIKRPSGVSDSQLRIIRVTICNNKEEAIVFCHEPFVLNIEFVVTKSISDVVFGWSVHSGDNVRLFECSSIDRIGIIKEIKPGRYIMQTSLEDNPLNPGLFSLYVGARCASKGLEYLPDVMRFQVERLNCQHPLWLEERGGAMSFDPEWSEPLKEEG